MMYMWGEGVYDVYVWGDVYDVYVCGVYTRVMMIVLCVCGGGGCI